MYGESSKIESREIGEIGLNRSFVLIEGEAIVCRKRRGERKAEVW
jgi:hypothetical protein